MDGAEVCVWISAGLNFAHISNSLRFRLINPLSFSVSTNASEGGVDGGGLQLQTEVVLQRLTAQ